MANDQQAQDPATAAPAQAPEPQQKQDVQPHVQSADNFDGLEGKKPEELTPEELRLMADTMPGEGPGD
ncbi:hypothetical protein [Massilia niastensis]|uniref:hypothetical protein n=1 Tax=Massilia niastensis TaxID=544911 RepID=UPI00036C4CBD|nr:hypothetical protein [Massilia niastensis]